jgi:hypothetical protein
MAGDGSLDLDDQELDRLHRGDPDPDDQRAVVDVGLRRL